MSRASFQTRARDSGSAMFCSIIAKSPPAENILPAPVMMTALTEGSRSTSRQISASSACMSASAVFIRPLSIVIRSTFSAGRSNFRRV